MYTAYYVSGPEILLVFGFCAETTTQDARKMLMAGSPWKHKKGPAPARPTPQRRPVKEMPIDDIQTEIGDIEVREQELERQGMQLEQMIRERTETGRWTE